MSSPNGNHTNGTSANAAPRALTSKQERRLVDFLDETFLQLTRNFKKRWVHPPYVAPALFLLTSLCQVRDVVQGPDPTCIPRRNAPYPRSRPPNTPDRPLDQPQNRLPSPPHRGLTWLYPGLQDRDWGWRSRDTPRPSGFPGRFRPSMGRRAERPGVGPAHCRGS